MSKIVILLKAFAIVLGILVAAWLLVIFLTAMAAEWAGDMKRKLVDTPPIK